MDIVNDDIDIIKKEIMESGETIKNEITQIEEIFMDINFDLSSCELWRFARDFYASRFRMVYYFFRCRRLRIRR